MTWVNRYEIMATDLAGNTFGLGQFERFERFVEAAKAARERFNLREFRLSAFNHRNTDEHDDGLTDEERETLEAVLS